MTSIRSSSRHYLQDCLTFFGVRKASNPTPNRTLSDRLQIASYFTVIIPLLVAGIFLVASISHRVTRKKKLTPVDQTVQANAHKILGINLPDPVSLKEFSNFSSLNQFQLVLGTYHPKFQPKVNKKNLDAYANSEDYQRHAKTARIYYNGTQLAEEDALRTIFQREPTNITMGAGQYDQEVLEKLFGYSHSVFNTPGAVKANGTSYADLPNTAAVYSETFMWDPQNSNPKEIACLSLPAPALDSPQQPHYNYYVQENELNAARYQQEMEFLFNLIEKSVRDNQTSAFGGAGLKRIVLSRFGQLAFLGAISLSDRKVANDIFREQLAQFLEKIKDTGLPVVMSEYAQPEQDNTWHDDMIIGDIVHTVQPGDFVLNPWDPHAAPGNGNDADYSFDGAMGKGSGILLTQTSWLNPTLRTQECLVPVFERVSV